MQKKYKLNIQRDVDVSAGGGPFSDAVDYILNLPHGFRFYNEIVHVRGYDSMLELKTSARDDVIVCDCAECLEGLK